MAAGPEPGTGWPFLITPGLSAPMGVALIPAPLEDQPEDLPGLLDGRRPMEQRQRRPERVELPGRRTGWIAYHRAEAVSDGLARIWHTKESREVILTGHTGRVTACCFSPDERHVATSSWDRTARVWETGTGRQVAQFDQHEAWVSGVTFTPDGRQIVTTCWDGDIRAFDLRSREVTASWTMSAPLIRSASGLAGQHLISAGADNLVRTADLMRPSTSAVLLLDGHTDEITTCVISPDARLIVSGGRDRTLVVWDARTGERLATLTGHDDWVSAAAFSPDGRWLVSAGWDGRLMRWGLDGSREQIAAHGTALVGCDVWPRNGFVITTGADGHLRWWDTAAKALLQSTKVGNGVPAGCVSSPSGRLLAITSIDDGPEGDHAVRDRAGRPIIMTEGVLYTGAAEPAPLTDGDLAHLQAIAISGLGRYLAAEAYGGEIVTSASVSLPSWERTG